MEEASEDTPRKTPEQHRPSLPERIRTRLNTWWTERVSPSGVTRAYMDMYDRIGTALGASGSVAEVFAKCRGILNVQAKIAGIGAMVGDIALVPITAGITLGIGRYYSPYLGSSIGFMVDQQTRDLQRGWVAAVAVGDAVATIGAIRAGASIIKEAPLHRLAKAQARAVGKMAPIIIDKTRALKGRVDQAIESIRQPAPIASVPPQSVQ